MYQYNSIMSAVNDFIDEVNEADSEAKLIKPHTIKEAYELLAGYYGKETGAELLAEYEAGRPHDVADATKLLLDVLKNKNHLLVVNGTKYYVSKGAPIKLYGKKDGIAGTYISCPAGVKVAIFNSCDNLRTDNDNYSEYIGYNIYCVLNDDVDYDLYTIDENALRSDTINEFKRTGLLRQELLKNGVRIPFYYRWLEFIAVLYRNYDYFIGFSGIVHPFPIGSDIDTTYNLTFGRVCNLVFDKGIEIPLPDHT